MMNILGVFVVLAIGIGGWVVQCEDMKGVTDSDADYDDESGDYDSIPFAVWLEVNGVRCSGSLVRRFAVLTARGCVDRRSEGGEVYGYGALRVLVGSGGVGGRTDMTLGAVMVRQVHNFEGGAGGGDLAVIMLGAPLPSTRPVIFAELWGGSCGFKCHVVEGAGGGARARVRAARTSHMHPCPRDLVPPAHDHHGVYCIRETGITKNDLGTGEICSGKLCGVITRLGNNGIHAAAAIPSFRTFLHCVLEDRHCEGACLNLCVAELLDMEGVSSSKEVDSAGKVEGFDFPDGGVRGTFHHVNRDLVGNKSFFHTGPNPSVKDSPRGLLDYAASPVVSMPKIGDRIKLSELGNKLVPFPMPDYGDNRLGDQMVPDEITEATRTSMREEEATHIDRRQFGDLSPKFDIKGINSPNFDTQGVVSPNFDTQEDTAQKDTSGGTDSAAALNESIVSHESDTDQRIEKFQKSFSEPIADSLEESAFPASRRRPPYYGHGDYANGASGMVILSHLVLCNVLVTTFYRHF